jgi:isoquinoline 1-oxidoreductase beta subunit
LRIGTDNSVTVMSKHLEMGQGTYTGLATILAEELDADWASTVRVEGAAADAKRYNNLFWGPTQGTGGSTAMANSWDQMRQAGAAGGPCWFRPPPSAGRCRGRDCRARRRRQPCRQRRKASFGELALDAAKETVPASVKLKDPKDFRLIGKQAKRKDSAAKTNGRRNSRRTCTCPACWSPWSPIRRVSAPR